MEHEVSLQVAIWDKYWRHVLPYTQLVMEVARSCRHGKTLLEHGIWRSGIPIAVFAWLEEAYGPWLGCLDRILAMVTLPYFFGHIPVEEEEILVASTRTAIQWKDDQDSQNTYHYLRYDPLLSPDTLEHVTVSFHALHQQSIASRDCGRLGETFHSNIADQPVPFTSDIYRVRYLYLLIYFFFFGEKLFTVVA